MGYNQCQPTHPTNRIGWFPDPFVKNEQQICELSLASTVYIFAVSVSIAQKPWIERKRCLL